MTVSSKRRTVDNLPLVNKWQWVLMTAKGRWVTEGHTQCAAAGIKQLAAGSVWQGLNHRRRAMGGGTVQTTSCGQQAASARL